MLSIPTVLIVDDEELILWSLESALAREGYHVLRACTGQEAWEVCQTSLPDVVLLDIVLPDVNGIDLMSKLIDFKRDLIIILITAYGTISSAVRAMKLGAYDFISKPFKLEEVRKRVQNALEPIRLKKEIEHLRKIQKEQYGFDNIIGTSGPMVKVFEMVKRIASCDSTTVLLEGESGTGKELISRAIHYQSIRHSKPFIEVNCTTLPDSLLESELLG
ncbi:MAG: sigma-54-dependent Fis family transcriptional regulator, partial [Candidatus Tectomicrobia bacterium]|nr:sigma-54-dependent Fis family transcriptional regulator [Candidatus Tectomicrobia bacterium]